VNQSSTPELRRRSSFFSALALVSAVGDGELSQPDPQRGRASSCTCMALAGLYISLAAALPHRGAAHRVHRRGGGALRVRHHAPRARRPGAAATTTRGRSRGRPAPGPWGCSGCSSRSPWSRLRTSRRPRAHGRRYGTIKPRRGSGSSARGCSPSRPPRVLLTAAVVGAFAVARAHHQKVSMSGDDEPPPAAKTAARRRVSRMILHLGHYLARLGGDLHHRRRGLSCARRNALDRADGHRADAQRGEPHACRGNRWQTLTPGTSPTPRARDSVRGEHLAQRGRCSRSS
jgi:hypothetical protein